MEYVTNGMRLYRVVSQREIRNYGLRGGSFSETMLEDCYDGKVGMVDDLTMLTLTVVR